MMLTLKQPPSYGYKSIHDLPTPPSTSRTSPPIAHLEASHKQPQPTSRSHSPVYQPMPAPHRGLPPPAAMALPPQQPGLSSVGSIPPPPLAQSLPPPPPPPPPPPTQPSMHHSRAPSASPQSLQQQAHQPWTTTALPAPPHQWQGAEESMRNWLQARTEEEKTKQEEEKTRQETLRLEQRKVEMDMLRASLGGGIPPPMVPLVFAGMTSNGVLPQAAFEWAQQFMQSIQSGQQAQSAQQSSQDAAERDISQTHLPFPGGAGSTQSTSSFQPYGDSPTRTRGHTVSGSNPGSRSLGPAANLPSLNTSLMQQGQSAPLAVAVGPGVSHQAGQGQTAPPETSPSIYFHHWQPPTSQTGTSSNRPSTPSGETPRKRKAGGPPLQTTGEAAPQSPPPLPPQHISQTRAPSPTRRSHKHRRSDLSGYQMSSRRERFEAEPYSGRVSPPYRPASGLQYDEKSGDNSRRHSVSSMLSADHERPSQAAHGFRGPLTGAGGEGGEPHAPASSRPYHHHQHHPPL